MDYGRLDVTEKELLDLIQSDEFRGRLGRAARLTMQTGHETGFRLYRDVERAADYLSPVVEGGTDEIDSRVYDEWERETLPDWPTENGSDGPTENGFYLLLFHFHPEFGEPLQLSYTDILLTDSSYDFETRPIVGIGNVDKHRHGYVTLLQRTFSGGMADEYGNEIAAEVWDKFQRAKEQWQDGAFARCLEVPGYLKADALLFDIPPRSHRATIRNPEVITRFAYSIDLGNSGLEGYAQWQARARDTNL